METYQILTHLRHHDQRGSFLKIFNKEALAINRIEFEVREFYVSHSIRNVIRGMHFQLPPHQHKKIITCQSGVILDVFVDLRKESSEFGKAHSVVLDSKTPQSIYLPEGFAHGFKTLSETAEVSYLVSTAYHPESDAGILWSSIAFNWEIETPILSERDQNFSPFQSFQTPF
jgi:dTDP-4-dehydrorhamnose 3,5-epimerase